MPLPPGQWTPLLVGEHWPTGSSVEALAAAAASRAGTAAALEEYADLLQAARFGPLAVQQGFTAEAIHGSFLRGESHSRDLAGKNRLKQQAYRAAAASTEALRDELRDIARHGNAAIEQARSSGASHAEQVNQIVGVIADAREHCGRAAATHCDGLFGDIQRVLSTSRVETSSREFARSHGFDGKFRAPLPSDLHDRVSGLLKAAAAAGISAVSTAATSGGGVTADPSAPPAARGTGNAAHQQTPTPPLRGRPATAPTGGPRPPTAAQPGGALPYGSAGRSVPPAPLVRGAPAPAPVTSSPAAGPTVRPFTVPAAAVGVSRTERVCAATTERPADRLRRLLHAVAAQLPAVRWAIAERPDGSTVLVTDLAGGWIPPGIDIPAGVTLLAPSPRRADLAGLLGTTTVSVIHQPGQSLSPGQPSTPVAMSPQARQVTPVGDLRSRLGRASGRWAAALDGGEDGGEVSRLRTELDAVAARVLGAYPDDVDPGDVSRWQLLASTAALVEGERLTADYHFAWFATHHSSFEEVGRCPTGT